MPEPRADAPSDPLDRLVSAAGAALVRLRARIVARYDLSATALDVLAALAEPVSTQRDLAARLGLTPATLTPVLAELEARGLLARSRDAGDRRVVRTRLTARGAATADTVLEAVQREWHASLPGAGPDEAAVRRYLERLVSAAGYRERGARADPGLRRCADRRADHGAAAGPRAGGGPAGRPPQ